jgi:hypothetical protein
MQRRGIAAGRVHGHPRSTAIARCTDLLSSPHVRRLPVSVTATFGSRGIATPGCCQRSCPRPHPRHRYRLVYRCVVLSAPPAVAGLRRRRFSVRAVSQRGGAVGGRVHGRSLGIAWCTDVSSCQSFRRLPASPPSLFGPRGIATQRRRQRPHSRHRHRLGYRCVVVRGFWRSPVSAGIASRSATVASTVTPSVLRP